MPKRFTNTLRAAFLFALVFVFPATLSGQGEPVHQGASSVIRVATFNVKELSREKLDTIDSEGRGTHRQLTSAATIIQLVRPDILLINEIDFDEAHRANARLFLTRYLHVAQQGTQAIDYADVFFEPVNTGVPTGLDLNRDEKLDGPEDAYGYGRYPGQYGMALYSRYPIDHERARTFQLLLWKSVPGHLMPDGREGRPACYDEEARDRLRLSSKSHWDVPVKIGDVTLHLLASHPTPPVFDGPEDRNGRRNFDEIRFWKDYLTGGTAANYIRDDEGDIGGLSRTAKFVILGDLNAEPVKGESVNGAKAIDQLLDHPRIQDPQPEARSQVKRSHRLPGTKPTHRATYTSNFGRLDYVLPGKDLRVIDRGVFAPAKDSPQHALVHLPDGASDHYLVWVDIELDAKSR